MSTRVPPDPEPGSPAQPEHSDAVDVRPTQDGAVDDDPPSAVNGTDDIAPWADMWRQALQAGFGTVSAPSPDERPADAN